MAILGTGIDIVENYRLKEILLKKKSNFKKKIFTINEVAYCEKKSNSINCYCKRFAAKEAFVKSLGTGFRYGLNLKDISIINDKLGKPSFFINKKIKNLIKKRFKINSFNFFLSISDEKKYSIAFVVFQK